MLKIKTTAQFNKDYKLAKRRGCEIAKLEKVLEILVSEKHLPAQYRDHALRDTSYYNNVRECHIQPDWLLVYRIENELKILRLIRTGTHSDLF